MNFAVYRVHLETMSKAEGGFLVGKILVAMPGIGDPRFERAVIFMCAHDADHALGLTINQPLEGLTMSEVLKKMGLHTHADSRQNRVLLGGPVHRDNGFVLHTDDYVSIPPPGTEPATLQIGSGIALTATRDVLEAMASPTSRPRKAVMALGYAGWGAGQLEQELRDNVWLICAADEALLFGDDHEHKWQQALAKPGVNPDQLSGASGRA